MRGYKRDKAQALLELAVFGAIFLVFFGLLISYGMKYNFQQQVRQQAFRKALSEAVKPTASGDPRGSITYIYVKDRHIADPTSPFGIGEVNPDIASATITRDYMLNKTATQVEELPAMAIEIKGSAACASRLGADPKNPSLCYYLTAGFRDINVSTDSCDKQRLLKKYELVYGYTNVDDHELRDRGEDAYEGPTANPLITVIDSCEGEILSYDSCKMQCAMVPANSQVCVDICNEGDGTNCSQTCSYAIETPPYCDKLDQLFAFASNYTSTELKSMGIQSDSASLNQSINTLRKVESNQEITTTDTFNVNDSSVRMIVFRQYGDWSGNVVSQEVPSAAIEDRARIWKTPWD